MVQPGQKAHGRDVAPLGPALDDLRVVLIALMSHPSVGQVAPDGARLDEPLDGAPGLVGRDELRRRQRLVGHRRSDDAWLRPRPPDVLRYRFAVVQLSVGGDDGIEGEGQREGTDELLGDAVDLGLEALDGGRVRAGVGTGAAAAAGRRRRRPAQGHGGGGSGRGRRIAGVRALHCTSKYDYDWLEQRGACIAPFLRDENDS